MTSLIDTTFSFVCPWFPSILLPHEPILCGRRWLGTRDQSFNHLYRWKFSFINPFTIFPWYSVYSLTTAYPIIKLTKEIRVKILTISEDFWEKGETVIYSTQETETISANILKNTPNGLQMLNIHRQSEWKIGIKTQLRTRLKVIADW